MNSCPNHTDEELVDLLRQGDSAAFESIYRKYVKDLFVYALRRIRVREDCEEIVHDVFESLCKRRETLAILSLKHYLFNSVRYMVIRYFSHQGVKQKFAEYYRLFEAMYAPMDERVHRDPNAIRGVLLRYLEGLPERCQEAIRLRLTENLSNGEIAKRMHVSKGTVELYISKAFRHFRTSYDEIFRLVD